VHILVKEVLGPLQELAAMTTAVVVPSPTSSSWVLAISDHHLRGGVLDIHLL